MSEQRTPATLDDIANGATITREDFPPLLAKGGDDWLAYAGDVFPVLRASLFTLTRTPEQLAASCVEDPEAVEAMKMLFEQINDDLADFRGIVAILEAAGARLAAAFAKGEVRH